MRPPGSKSITNRALIIAALAEGTSTLTGVLDSDDTRVMIDSLQQLGYELAHDVGERRGHDSRPQRDPARTPTCTWRTAAPAFAF